MISVMIILKKINRNGEYILVQIQRITHHSHAIKSSKSARLNHGILLLFICQ